MARQSSAKASTAVRIRSGPQQNKPVWCDKPGRFLILRLIMFPKIIKWVALLSVIGLIICCYMPWTFFPDIKETFSGFYSHKNEYGKPGVLIVPVAIVVGILLLLNKIWAKRVNLFITALLLGYVIKSYVLFTNCYGIYCPEKQPAVYLIVLFSFLMLTGAIFPQMKLATPEK